MPATWCSARLVVLMAALVFGTSSCLGAADLPAHLTMAQDVLSQLKPANNAYGRDPTLVRLQTSSLPAVNRSVCSTFLLALMQQCYHYTDQDVASWFNRKTPDLVTANDIAEAFSHGRGITAVPKIDEVLPGDIIVISYPGVSTSPAGGEEVAPDAICDSKRSPTGHIMIIEAKPQSEAVHSSPSGFAGRSWLVTIIDSSFFPHGKGDTRSSEGAAKSGLGRATIRLVSDTDKTILGYTWTTLHTSPLYLTTRHPLLIARLTTASHP